MVILSMFSWWYTSGLRDEFARIKRMFARVSDQFSIKLLFKTLFQPFRQISANVQKDGPLEERIRAWLDRVFSRIIGAGIRSFVIVVGLTAMLFTIIFGALRLTLWAILPILPFAGIFLINEVGIPWS